jgi:hypothetical protein
MAGNTSNKSAKNKILLVLTIIAITLLVMYILTLVIPMIGQKLIEHDEEETLNFKFYEPDYEEDIFQDEKYMSLINDGFLSYDNGSNSISQIYADNTDQFGEQVELLAKLVYSIQNGDDATYNSFFSEEYLSKNGKKENFTMQKIYDATITYYSTENVSDRNGNYTKYIYKLKYRIYQNNGTFRQDIDEDAKTQYIVITDREGKLLIDAVSTTKYK